MEFHCLKGSLAFRKPCRERQTLLPPPGSLQAEPAAAGACYGVLRRGHVCSRLHASSLQAILKVDCPVIPSWEFFC